MTTVGTIPSALIQNSVFKTKIVSIFEKMRVFAPIATMIRAKAKVIDVPTLSVSGAKNHSLACKTSIGTATPGNETISLDTKTDWSIDYCEDDFLGDEVGFKTLIKEQGLAEISKKLNQNFAINVLAGATAVAGTIDLSTKELVNNFVTSVALIASRNSFMWKPRVEHGTVVRAKYQGKAFIMAGSEAYQTLLNAYSLFKLGAVGGANDVNNMFTTPNGVVVIDANDTLGDAKQMIYGIAGAPVHAYREDKVREFDERVVTRTTAGADSGDVLSADAMIQRNYNMGAEIWNKAAVPVTVGAMVKKQLMA